VRLAVGPARAGILRAVQDHILTFALVGVLFASVFVSRDLAERCGAERLPHSRTEQVGAVRFSCQVWSCSANPS
jgi:hypothetical protein